MPMPNRYADRNCSLARALEVFGERWTLLIVRDAFYGVSRFSDFAAQLGIPRAILTRRLKALVQEGVLTREHDSAGTVEYRLTGKGIALWPAIRALMNWGDSFCSPGGTRRVQLHDQDGGLLDEQGRCRDCGLVVPVPQIRMEPGPGFVAADADDDPVSRAIDAPRRLLEPVALQASAPQALSCPLAPLACISQMPSQGTRDATGAETSCSPARSRTLVRAHEAAASRQHIPRHPPPLPPVQRERRAAGPQGFRTGSGSFRRQP